MVGSINKVILVGNVGKDPDIRSTHDGREIAYITLATSDSWKDKTTGERKDRTEWHRIVIFSEGLVNVTKNYIRKGSKLYIEGALQTRKWTDSNGIEKYSTEVILQGYNCSLVILDRPNSNNHSAESNNDYNNNASNDFDIDDDLPF